MSTNDDKPAVERGSGPGPDAGGGAETEPQRHEAGRVCCGQDADRSKDRKTRNGQELIAAGDFVYIYSSERMKYLVQVPAKGRFSTHRGHIEYDSVIGRNWGDEVKTHLGFRFWLLRPVLADLAMKVSRQTTIVYPKDAGVMIMQTLVQPGMRVVETGSGSGALTTILASLVGPEGRVYSYERRPEFSANARHNVRRYGLEERCEFFVRDPELNGFDQVGIDTVCLDVPEPWSLLPAAHSALKGGNPLVAIVPTFEQVRRTVSALELVGFSRIRVQEILERHIFVRPSGIRPADRMVAHTVYIITGQKVHMHSPEAQDRVEDSEQQATREPDGNGQG